MLFDDETVLCPVDGCTQPHRARVRAIIDAPITKINIRMVVRSAVVGLARPDWIGTASAAFAVMVLLLLWLRPRPRTCHDPASTSLGVTGRRGRGQRYDAGWRAAIPRTGDKFRHTPHPLLHRELSRHPHG